MTLYFQLQFLELKCSENAKSTFKNVLKREKKKKLSSLKKKVSPRTKKISRS